MAGAPLVVHAVRRLLEAGVTALVVAAPASHLEDFRALLAPLGREAQDVPDDDGAPRRRVHLDVVPGGASRQASVAAALAVLPPGEVVLVHDAARCFAPPAMLRRVIDAVRAGHRAVIPVVPVVDSLVTALSEGPVDSYEDRSRLRVVQTPQGFERATLELAHAAPAPLEESAAATDDASLAAGVGETVWAVPGDDAAMKITTPRDLALAQVLFADEGAE